MGKLHHDRVANRDGVEATTVVIITHSSISTSHDLEMSTGAQASLIGVAIACGGNILISLAL